MTPSKKSLHLGQHLTALRTWANLGQFRWRQRFFARCRRKPPAARSPPRSEQTGGLSSPFDTSCGTDLAAVPPGWLPRPAGFCRGRAPTEFCDQLVASFGRCKCSCSWWLWPRKCCIAIHFPALHSKATYLCTHAGVARPTAWRIDDETEWWRWGSPPTRWRSLSSSVARASPAGGGFHRSFVVTDFQPAPACAPLLPPRPGRRKRKSGQRKHVTHRPLLTRPGAAEPFSRAVRDDCVCVGPPHAFLACETRETRARSSLAQRRLEP